MRSDVAVMMPDGKSVIGKSVIMAVLFERERVLSVNSLINCSELIKLFTLNRALPERSKLRKHTPNRSLYDFFRSFLLKKLRKAAKL